MPAVDAMHQLTLLEVRTTITCIPTSLSEGKVNTIHDLLVMLHMYATSKNAFKYALPIYDTDSVDEMKKIVAGWILGLPDVITFEPENFDHIVVRNRTPFTSSKIHPSLEHAMTEAQRLAAKEHDGFLVFRYVGEAKPNTTVDWNPATPNPEI